MPPIPDPTLGDLIRRARKDAGYTQAELAELVGDVSQGQVSKWEQNQREPSAREFFRIVHVTGAEWLEAALTVDPVTHIQRYAAA